MSFSDGEIKRELRKYGFLDISPAQFQEFKHQLFVLIDNEKRGRGTKHSTMIRQPQNDRIATSKMNNQNLCNFQDIEKDLGNSMNEGDLSIEKSSEYEIGESQIHEIIQMLKHNRNLPENIEVENDTFESNGDKDNVSLNNSFLEQITTSLHEALNRIEKNDNVTEVDCSNSRRDNEELILEDGNIVSKPRQNQTLQTASFITTKTTQKTSYGRSKSRLNSIRKPTPFSTPKHSPRTSLAKPTETYHSWYSWNEAPPQKLVNPECTKRRNCKELSSGIKRIDQSVPESRLKDAFRSYHTLKSKKGCEQVTPSVLPKKAASNSSMRSTALILPPHERYRQFEPSIGQMMEVYNRSWAVHGAPGEDKRDDVRIKMCEKMFKKFEIKKEKKTLVKNMYKRPHEMDRNDVVKAIKAAHKAYKMPEHGFYHPINNDETNKKTKELFW